jgi:hypothetical protein
MPTANPTPATAARAMKPTDYRYDVFISYAHAAPVKRWVQEYFGFELQNYLGALLNRTIAPRIFMDRWDIHSGDEWEARLGHALRESIFMVPVLTADYLRSRWCKAELEAFLKRERAHKLVAADGTGGLVRPVLWVPFDPLPRMLTRKEFVDMSDFAYDNQAFRNSQKYMDFQNSVRDFARLLSKRDGYLFKPPPKSGIARPRDDAADEPAQRMRKPRFL